MDLNYSRIPTDVENINVKTYEWFYSKLIENRNNPNFDTRVVNAYSSFSNIEQECNRLLNETNELEVSGKEGKILIDNWNQLQINLNSKTEEYNTLALITDSDYEKLLSEVNSIQNQISEETNQNIIDTLQIQLNEKNIEYQKSLDLKSLLIQKNNLQYMLDSSHDSAFEGKNIYDLWQQKLSNYNTYYYTTFQNAQNNYNSILEEVNRDIDTIYNNYVKNYIISNILIKKPIYGPYFCIILGNNEYNFNSDFIRNQEITSNECLLTLEDFSENVNVYVFSFTEKMAHYYLYCFSKWFEPKIPSNQNISDWLESHLKHDINDPAFINVELYDVEGYTIPTYEDLNNISIVPSSGLIGRFKDGFQVAFLGLITSSGVLSSLLLIRDKILELKTGLVGLSNAIQAHTIALNNINANLLIINNKLNLLNEKYNPPLWS